MIHKCKRKNLIEKIIKQRSNKTKNIWLKTSWKPAIYWGDLEYIGLYVKSVRENGAYRRFAVDGDLFRIGEYKHHYNNSRIISAFSRKKGGGYKMPDIEFQGIAEVIRRVLA